MSCRHFGWIVSNDEKKPFYNDDARLTDHNIFIILYGVTSVYFAGVMVRLMLVLAPVMCILGGIAISASLSSYMKYLEGSGELGAY